MKKIYKYLAVALFATVAFTSCDDDDNTYVVDPTANMVTITERETSFQAGPSDGYILVDADAPVTVTTPASWITTSVDGNRINIHTDWNSSLNGRSSMLTIKSGEKTSQVAIIQAGIVLEGLSGDISSNDNAKSFTMEFNANCPVEISSGSDWITTEVEGQTLKISLLANTTGHIREGYINWSAGAFNDKIKIEQFDFTKDLAGSMRLCFTDPEDDKEYYFNGTLKKNGTAYTYEIPAANFTIPVTYNAADKSLTIAGGAYIGTYLIGTTTYYMFTCVWDIEGKYLSWGTSYSIGGSFKYEEDKHHTVCELGDTGSWANHEVTGLLFEAFTAETATSTTRAGSVFMLEYPYFERIDPTNEGGSAAPARNVSVKVPGQQATEITAFSKTVKKSILFVD